VVLGPQSESRLQRGAGIGRLSMGMRALRLQIVDPGLFSLKYAARAAIVLPAVVAFADNVIKNQQTTFLSAFGSVAILVLTNFGGPPRTRLAAYLALTAAGAVLISLGTLCSRTPWLAVVAMAVVGFLILLAGVISGYFAAARIPALLTFILPVSIPAPPSAIPARLEGWALAASVGIGAVMLLWPSQPRDRLRAAAARATRALADLVGSELSGGPSAIADRSDAASAAVGEFRRSFVATPDRPTGPTGSTEAVAFLVDELDWMLSFASPTRGRIEARSEPCHEENREVMAAVVAVLRASAANLDGERRRPDLDRLERAREAVARTLVQRVADLPGPQEEVAQPAALEPSFRMRELSFAAREVGVNALRASGAVTRAAEGASHPRSDHLSRWRALARRVRSALRATQRLVAAHASLRSASFRNSLRGAAGLAVAVLIGQLATLQHSFWVVLATLSVLRSNALGTGSTVLQALAGTAAGIVIGGALIAAIGSDEPVLWVLLPPAVLLAAYAPRAISFAAGQAGFTIVLLILFNIIQPTGWTVGLVRVEDVGIGFAISLAVGLLFWPRGVRDLLRKSLSAAYARSADYVASATRSLLAAEGAGWTEYATQPARQIARGAANRLDDAFREYLAESRARHANLEGVATLVAGSTRVRLAAYSLSTLTPAPAGGPRIDQCAQALAADVDALHSWYFSLADALVDGTAIPPPHPRDDDATNVARCVRQALATGDDSIVGPAVSLLWASQHLDNLRELGAHLIQPAGEFSSNPRP
jgi:uncharacterized membrane protein YccC